MTKSEQQVHDDIQQYGYHITHVENFHGELEAPFSYSIGLYQTFQKPEIIIIGLKMELRQTLIHNIFYDYKNGLELKAGQLNSDILDDFDCLVVEVDKDKYKGFVNWAMWFYNYQDFPLQQIVYPTLKGIFPWNKEFPKNAEYPILCDNFKNGFK